VPDPPPARSGAPTPLIVSGGARAFQTGRRGEELAAAHMQRLGFRVLARNARTAAGEIDLIAFNGRVLVFAEVKTTRCRAPAGRQPAPLERLQARQRASLRRLASAWLLENAGARPHAQTLRFDAIGVVLGRRGELVSLEHLESAW
jgi:putative endonuclease